MSRKKKKLGLVVGRFQPLHDGHKYLINKAVSESDIIAICIGASKKNDPLTFKERRRRLDKFLSEIDTSGKEIRTNYVRDEKTDRIWLNKAKMKLGITDKTMNTFYTGDIKLSTEYMRELSEHGITVKMIKRHFFNYVAPDKKTYRISSATEIRKLHRKTSISV